MPAESATHDKLLYTIVGLLLCLIGGFFLWVRAQDQATYTQSRPVQVAQATLTPAASPPRLAVPKQREAKSKPRPTLPARPKPKPQPVVRPIQPEVVAPRGPDEAAYPVARGSRPAPSRTTEPLTPPINNTRGQVQDGIAGFWRTGDVIGAGGVYSKTVNGYRIDIRTHEFPGQTRDQIRERQGSPMIGYPSPIIRNRGWCTGNTFSDRHQGWHINDGVMYDIQVRPAHFDSRLMGEVDRFLDAYPPPRT